MKPLFYRNESLSGKRKSPAVSKALKVILLFVVFCFVLNPSGKCS